MIDYLNSKIRKILLYRKKINFYKICKILKEEYNIEIGKASLLTRLKNIKE